MKPRIFPDLLGGKEFNFDNLTPVDGVKYLPVYDAASGKFVLEAVPETADFVKSIPAAEWSVAVVTGKTAAGTANYEAGGVFGRAAKTFATAADRYMHFGFRPPDNWNGGSLSFSLDARHVSTTSGQNTLWKCRGFILKDNDQITGKTYGTPGSLTLAMDGASSSYAYITPESSAFTANGSFAPGDTLILELYRNGTDAADDYTNSVEVYGVNLTMTLDV